MPPNMTIRIAYNVSTPKVALSLIPITQDKEGKVDGQDSPGPRLSKRVRRQKSHQFLEFQQIEATITHGIMYSILGNAFLNCLEYNPKNIKGFQICIDLPEELANGDVHIVTKETLTKDQNINEVHELK